MIGVDVARFGDDRSVIYPRRGRELRRAVGILADGLFDRADIEITQPLPNRRVGLGVVPAPALALVA